MKINMNEKINIAKALGMILVVAAHSCGPAYVTRFSYLLCVSIFFVCAGYCFNTKYLDDQTTFVKKRFKGIYLPFWKWSVFFLVFNHLWFYTGILSEKFGNSAGGVQHPLSFKAGLQALWSITFNMSGYDQFLCGAYWFFRAFFVASLLWILAMSVLNSMKPLRQRFVVAASVVAAVALALAVLHCEYGLKMTGVAQGGYRELMGLFFFAFGFIARRLLDNRGEYNIIRCMDGHRNLCTLAAFVAVILIVCLNPVAMDIRAKNVLSVFVLALSGAVGFVFLVGLSGLIERFAKGRVRSVILYIGNNTLYIFGFHFFAFKLVSMAKVLCYGLEWQQIGGHPVVISEYGKWWWIIYLVVGVAVPLMVTHCLRNLKRKF